MERIKSFFSNYFLISLICVMVGVFFILNPDTIPKITIYIVGGVIIAFGVFLIGSFVMANKGGEDSPAKIIQGIIFAAIGVFVLIRGDFIYRAISLALGTYMLASGLVSLYNALRIRKHNRSSGWQLTCVLSSLTIIAGAVMLFTPLLPFVVLGVILVVSGVTNFFGSLVGKKKVEKYLGLPDSGNDDGGSKRDRGFIDIK